MRIVLGGVISRFFPGEVLLHRQHVEGLRRLGHEIVWIEQLEPRACVDRLGRPTDYEHCVNREGFVRAMSHLGLEASSAQLYDGGAETVGLSLPALLDLVSSADLLLNFSGHVRHTEILARVPRKAYMDPDPAFTQLWHAAYGARLGLEDHDVFFTRGVNIASGRSGLPDCGVAWHPLMPPLVTELWPAPEEHTTRSFTTVAAWGRYGDLEWKDRWYRSKNSEFARFAALPSASALEFGLALTGREYDPEVADALVLGGWDLVPGRSLSSIRQYLAFIQGSGAEIGIAKHAYVEGRTGWFSERSTQYLASGKPVLVQDTGLEGVLPTGLGIVTFGTLDEAVAGAQEIASNYSKHSRAARELAAEHFDHRRLLPRLLDRCFGTTARPTQPATATP